MLILILLSLLLFGAPVQAVNNSDGNKHNPPVLKLPPQAADNEVFCCGPDPIPPGQNKKGGN